VPENDIAASNATKLHIQKCVMGEAKSNILNPTCKLPCLADNAVSMVFDTNEEKVETPGVKSDRPQTSINSGVLSQGTSVSLHERLLQALLPSCDAMLSQSGPILWYKPLFPYQIDGIRALLAKGHLLLADDMGLGKTIQALGALRILFLKRMINIDCPGKPYSAMEKRDTYVGAGTASNHCIWKHNEQGMALEGSGAYLFDQL
jgi:hypothetical protein